MNLTKGVCSGQITDQILFEISNYDKINKQITDQIFEIWEKEKNSRQLTLPRIFYLCTFTALRLRLRV